MLDVEHGTRQDVVVTCSSYTDLDTGNARGGCLCHVMSASLHLVPGQPVVVVVFVAAAYAIGMPQDEACLRTANLNRLKAKQTNPSTGIGTTMYTTNMLQMAEVDGKAVWQNFTGPEWHTILALLKHTTWHCPSRAHHKKLFGTNSSPVLIITPL